VALEPAVVGVAQQVVGQPEEPEGHHGHEHGDAGGGGVGIAQPDQAEQRAGAVDGDHGRDEQEPGGGRQVVAAVVLAVEDGLGEGGPGGPLEEQGGHQPRHQGEHDGHRCSIGSWDTFTRFLAARHR